ncbi:hypothetical protein OIDMADRAFT_36373 [Oidiodendron maius Zn]|uniref:BZIP domain-containing protein n=1 Tax=Oidiodendron maius (strain Zn) TaxID=913774 RepID=A0A0C3GMH7_OIDMZ|nr:hypothetical protein OIDMADRAFT_36373 [Oidiodendron maius Zn]
MASTQDNMDELELKRQRNRLAQQKYRKRLKLHIDDLEKRAALVEQLPNVNVFPSIHPNGSVHDDMLEYYPFVHQMSGSAGAGWMQPLDTMTVASSQAYESSGISVGPSFPTAPSRIPDSSLTKPNCGQQQDSLGTPLKDGALGPSKASISPPGSTENQARNRPGSLPAKSLDDTPSPSPLIHNGTERELPSIDSRLEHVLQFLQSVKFDSIDSLVSSYYTAELRERSTLQVAQEASRIKGLPQVLEDLQVNSGSWSMRESYPYRDMTIRSAGQLIADELDRLSRKKYSCEIELQHHLSRVPSQPGPSDVSGLRQLRSLATELRKTLRDEMPNLHAFTSALSAHDCNFLEADKLQMITATIRLITASGHDTLEEAASWASKRSDSSFTSSSEDLDDSMSGSS